MLIAMSFWRRLLIKSQVVFYIDNDAAKSGLIKGAGATDEASRLIGCFTSLEMQLQCITWFLRVPSHSNVADGPSRLCFSSSLLRGAVMEEIPWEDFLG